MFRRVLILLPLLLTGQAFAGSLDINLHNDAMRVAFGTGVSGSKGTEMDVGHFFNNDDDTVTHLGLMVSGENWSKAGTFDIGLGTRALYINTDAIDLQVGAVAVGTRIRFSPIHRVGFGGEFFYAPDIITFLDGQRYWEASLRADYQVLPNGFVYLGYREMRVRYADLRGEYKPDNEAHLGMKLLF